MRFWVFVWVWWMGERPLSAHRFKFTPHHKKPTYNHTPTEARDALRQALLRFPVMLCPLVDKCRNELGSRVPQPWCVGVYAFFWGFVCLCVFWFLGGGRICGCD